VKQLASKLIVGIFVAIVAAIIFVKAGRSGESGGKQSAQIIGATGSAFAQGATALQGGA
jgi:hypothetical protein